MEGRAFGARCLVAWEQVCRPKLEGGLGIRCLSTQNLCLQVKMLHRLHASPGSPWASWVWRSIDGPVAPGQRGVIGPHWEKLVALMPLYRALSTVRLGDGARVSFWHDVWQGDAALCCSVPAIFSHSTMKEASLAAGERELAAIELLLAAVRLNDAADTRSLARCCKPNGDLRVSDLYKLCSLGGVEAPFCSFIWDGFAPSRVKFFGWLLVQSQIQCRAALRKKKIILPAEDICPICSAPHEDATHIALRCPFASVFWNAIGRGFAATAHISDLHALPGVTSGETASTFTLLCCWNL
jgi:hypothetical protein